ncbi:phenylalanine 4-monooxygenase [Marinicella sp. W31]|uniref:phenylalanine 4-monooxygenase n=1 Tax=Marinicella sp. W31 TaxID=3023713 RepID=UPI0037566B70
MKNKSLSMSRYTSTKYTAKQPDTHGFISYSDEEHQIWADLYQQQIPRVEQYMSQAYMHGLKIIDLPQDRIPQCVDISAALQEITGWSVQPVPALIGFGRFFNMLSQRQFPAASFIRTREDFGYVQEPDIFHEIFGHTPLLTDQKLADFSQKIGQLGLNAEPKDHAWLARLYWFTVEFGLVKQGENPLPFGSGLASSPTELEYAATSNIPVRQPFDIMTVLRTPYRIDIKQPIYFVLESLEQLTEIAERDLIADIHQAQEMGLNPPLHSVAKAS